MIIVDVNKYGSIEQALKILKNKTAKTKLVQKLREKQAYTKPSVTRRKEILDAVYKEKFKSN
jgi:small subunit ribosomal protein S21